MKTTTFNKISIFGGLGLAALVGAVSPESGAAMAPAFMGILGWLGGVAGNQVHSAIGSVLEPPPPDSEEVFRNHHIRALLRLAVRSIVEQTIKKVEYEICSASPELHAALEKLPELFDAELDNPNGTLSGIEESHVPDFLTQYAHAKGDIAIIIEDAWRKFIDASQPDLKVQEREALAAALHTQFGEALWNVVKRDAIADGQGFAAVELLYLSRILKAVESRTEGAVSPDVSELELRVTTLIGKLDYKQAAWFERLWSQAKRHHVADKAEHRKTHWLLQFVLKRLSNADAAQEKAIPFHADISRIIKYAPTELIGREAETALLTDAWAKVQAHEPKRPHILTFVALSGEGKTSLVAKWAAELAHQDWPGCDAVIGWSFYSQGSREQTAVSSDLFLAEALIFFGDAAVAGSSQGAFEKGRRLAQLVGKRPTLLILDGLKPLQYAPTSPKPGELKDQGAERAAQRADRHQPRPLRRHHPLCAARPARLPRPDRAGGKARAPGAGVQLLKAHGVTGSDRRNLPLHDGDAKGELVGEFEKLVEDVDGHALTLTLLGGFLKRAFHGDIHRRGLPKARGSGGRISKRRDPSLRPRLR